MRDRTDRPIGYPEWPSPRGPWPEADSVQRIFDHGAHWCINAAGHPGTDDNYPDATRHFPPYECRTRGLSVDARDGLHGSACDLEIYAARAYRFGELRTAAAPDDTRVSLDFYDDSPDDNLPRFSIALGDAVRVALHLLALVRSVDHPWPA